MSHHLETLVTLGPNPGITAKSGSTHPRPASIGLMVGKDSGDPASLQLVVDRSHQPVEACLVPGFGAGDQHVLRIRRPEQPPSVGCLDPDSVGRIDLGALGGKLAKGTIDKQFQEQVRAQVQPGTSALFMILEQMTADKALDALGKFGGTVIKTSLSAEQEAEIQAHLHGDA